MEIKHLYYYHRVTEWVPNKERKESFDKFENELKKHVKSRRKFNKLTDLALGIENITAEQNFVAGFKYAFTLIKELDLL